MIAPLADEETVNRSREAIGRVFSDDMLLL